MNGSTRYIAVEHPWIARDADTVLVASTSEGPLALSAPALWIWQELTAPKSLDDLCAVLSDRHDGSEDSLRADVARQLDALTALNLVRPL